MVDSLLRVIVVSRGCFVLFLEEERLAVHFFDHLLQGKEKPLECTRFVCEGKKSCVRKIRKRQIFQKTEALSFLVNCVLSKFFCFVQLQH